MDFAHPQDRQMLLDTLSRYLSQRYSIATRHAISASPPGWSREQWQAFAELGIQGALLTEAAGGFAGTGFDIGVVFEQIGRALVVEPFLGSLMAGRLLAAVGGQSTLLTEVVAGTAVVAFAHYEPEDCYNMTSISSQATRRGDGWVMSGRKAVIPQIGAADHLVVSAKIAGQSGSGNGVALFLVRKSETGLRLSDCPLADGGRGGELILDATPARLLSELALPLIETAVSAGIVALSWEAVGVMDVIKHDTLEFLRTRRQFGTPLGKFQALQHRMATLALEIEQARSAAINAAAALEGERPARERAVAAAKYTVGRAGTLVAEEAIQMHGGIGMTWELPLPHYAKRLIMIGHQLGDEYHHLERFVSLSRVAV